MMESTQNQTGVGAVQTAQAELSSPPIANPPSVRHQPVRRDSEGFRYYAPGRETVPVGPSTPVLSHPLKVVVVTSVRDIGGDDQVGKTVITPEHPDGILMRGTLQSLTEATCISPAQNTPEGIPGLGGIIEIAGVVTDDVEQELETKAPGYSVLPKEGMDWIAPHDLKRHDGSDLASNVINLPSLYRKLPLGDTQERALAKLRFESAIRGFAEEVGADVILSDHCIVKFEHLYQPGWFEGRAVNIHPAITWSEDPNRVRGLTPTNDTLERARTPNGHQRAGASLHLINSEFDAGEVILDAERTTVHTDDQPQQLRVRNYQRSKNPVAIQGLRHFATLLSNR